MDWSTLYPKFVDGKTVKDDNLPQKLDRDVSIADVGCGFGGLLMALSPIMPEELLIGFYTLSQCF